MSKSNRPLEDDLHGVCLQDDLVQLLDDLTESQQVLLSLKLLARVKNTPELWTALNPSADYFWSDEAGERSCRIYSDGSVIGDDGNWLESYVDLSQYCQRIEATEDDAEQMETLICLSAQAA